jgi:hypothetical protein
LLLVHIWSRIRWVEYKFLVGKPERKRQLERPGHRLEDVIRMDVEELSWGCGVDSVGSG